MKIPSKHKSLCGAFIALVSLASTEAFAAEQVSMRLKGSDIELSGRLRSIDGARFTLEVGSSGLISLDAADYDCIGRPCAALATPPSPPSPQAGTSTLVVEAPSQPLKPITIQGSAAIGLDFAPTLIRAFVGEMGASVKQLVGTDTKEASFRVSDSRGSAIADFQLRRHGSEAAFAALANGTAEIGLSTRPIAADELKVLAAAQPQIKSAEFERVIGLDGLVIIVPPGSGAKQLSLDTIARIFSGAIRDWSEVGLPPGRISIYLSAERTGSADAFAETVLRPRNLSLSPLAIRMSDEAELADAVARTPNAIGITSFAFVRNAKGLALGTPCGITAKPTAFAIKAEEYPLGRRLYAYTAGQPKDPMAQDLVRFAVSRKAQSIIRDAGFVDQSIESMPFAEQEPRLLEFLQSPDMPAAAVPRARQLLSEIGNARRLSVTFRFATGSSQLDAKARGDLMRLAELIRSSEFSGKTVLFLGFTDSMGTPAVNEQLSQRRAAEVRDAVQQLLPRAPRPNSMAALGFGLIAPAVCNVAGRSDTNRRVEVWVRDGDALPTTLISSSAQAAMAAAEARQSIIGPAGNPRQLARRKRKS